MSGATLSRRGATIASIAATFLLVRVAGAEPRIRHVQPPGLENNPRYSHAVVIEEGRFVHVSGQIAHDAAGHLVGRKDMRAQTKQVFENLKTALQASGSDFAHVVSLNSYLTDMSQLPAYREVRQQYLADLPRPPASTTVAVSRLVDPDALLEVEAVAVVAAASGSAGASEQVVVLANLTARSGKEAGLRKELLSRAAASRTEPGCVLYDVHQSREDPARFVLHEIWTNAAALEKHFQTPQMKAWESSRDEYVAAREVTRWRRLEEP